MRTLRVFALYAQHALEYRARNLVWFISQFLNPMMMLIFWSGAIQKSGGHIGSFTFSTISTYYFLLIIASTLLISFVEEDIADLDIKAGELVRYLLRPVSYYWIKFNEDFPYRLLRSSYGIIVFAFFLTIFHNIIIFNPTVNSIFITLIVSIFAYFITFTYKMCLGLSALWIIDSFGFFQLMEVVMILFAGMVIPISLMSPALMKISLLSPFPYMIYFPIMALQGKLVGGDLVNVIFIQMIWLAVFIGLYKLMWRQGIYKFTAVGQ